MIRIYKLVTQEVGMRPYVQKIYGIVTTVAIMDIMMTVGGNALICLHLVMISIRKVGQSVSEIQMQRAIPAPVVEHQVAQLAQLRNRPHPYIPAQMAELSQVLVV
jgi:hypothetical protein